MTTKFEKKLADFKEQLESHYSEKELPAWILCELLEIKDSISSLEERIERLESNERDRARNEAYEGF